MNYELLAFAKHFKKLGLNVTCIANILTENNFYDNDILKAPYHKWKHYKNQLQTDEEFENLDWTNAVGIGTVAGYENLHVLDIDGCNEYEFIEDLLILLKLPKNYEWVIKSGSGNGFHIYFYSDLIEELEENQVTSTFPSNEENIGLFEKIEILWNTHVVLPYSLHSSGLKYSFINCVYPNKKPDFIDIASFTNIELFFLNRTKLIKKKTYFGNFEDTENLVQPNDIEKIDLSKIKSQLIFLFDLETDGLIVGNKYPNVVQVSWMIMDIDGIVHKKQTLFINGLFDEKSEAFKINNLNPDFIKKIGKSPNEVYNILINDLKYCKTIVAHNIDFDYKILLNEFDRWNIFNLPKEVKTLCTMKWYHNKLLKEDKYAKFPKLTELYEYLFEHKIKQLHNANSDVIILSKCFKEMLFREVKGKKSPKRS
jgi:DNA polymerase III epsilon subunit-like protein